MKKRIGQMLLAVGTDFILLLILLYITLGGISKKTVKTVAAENPDWKNRVVALTFDDGPHPVYTRELLDGLRKRGVKATFFLMGANIEGNEELIRQMQQDGHLIGNHGYSHVQMTEEGIEKVWDSVEKTGKIIEEITGKEPEYLRPPYGDWNEELAEKMDLMPVFWSVDSLDWKYQNTPKITKGVLKEVEDGDIILMHDIFPTSVESALEIVDTLKAQGYTFVTADELMID